jgi:hypothetical protein
MVGPLKIQSNDILNKIYEFASDLIDVRLNIRTKRRTIKNSMYGLYGGVNSDLFGEQATNKNYGLYRFNDLSTLLTMRRIRIPTFDMVCSRFATRGISSVETPSINTSSFRTPYVLSNIDQFSTRIDRSMLSYQFVPFYPNIIDFINKTNKTGGGKRKKQKICYRIEEMKRYKRNMCIFHKLLDDIKSIEDLSTRLRTKFAILAHIKQCIRLMDIQSMIYTPNKEYECTSYHCYTKKVNNHYDIYPWMDMYHTKFGRVSDEYLKLSA